MKDNNKIPTLKEVSEHLDIKYKTIVAWDDKKKLLLRLGLQKYRENMNKLTKIKE